MRHHLVALVLVGLTTGVSLVGGQAPSSSHVRVGVFVERSEGRFVDGLTASDMEVAINGAPHTVRGLQRATGPVTWLLLVDASESLRRGGRIGSDVAVHDYPGIIKGIEEGFVDRLPGGDRLLVARFAGHKFWTLGSVTTHREMQRRAMRELLAPVEQGYAIGPSPIWDAVAAAVRLLASEPEPRGLVLVTDGHATANRLSMSEAAAEAAAQNVPVFVMYEAFWDGVKPDTFLGPGERFLRPLAAHTGGVFRLNDATARVGWQDPLPRFNHFIDAMHARLVVDIEVAALPPGRHLLEVSAKEKALTVHAPAWVWVR
jgi:hypothetical protein